MIRLGIAALRRPKLTVGTWIVVTIALGVASIGIEQRLSQATFLVRGSESEHTFNVQREHFGLGTAFAVLVEGQPARVKSRGMALARALDRTPNYSVLSPWEDGSARELRPNHRTAVIALTVNAPVDDPYRLKALDVAAGVQEVVDRHGGSGVRVSVTGPATVGLGLQEAALSSTEVAEMIAAPLLLIILLFVFRSLAAAAIPLVFGGASVASGFGILSLLTPVAPIDALAMTFASLLGLALGVDYSLLMVSRFREELARGRAPARAAAEATRKAGHTVIAAGVLLGVGMAISVVVLPPGVLFSAAVGALVTTIVSVLLAVLVLPSVLALLGPNINRWRIGRQRRSGPSGLLERIASRRPVPVVAVLPILAILALVALPATDLRAETPGPELLPSGNAQRQDYDRFVRMMGPGWGGPFQLLVVAKRGSIAKRDLLHSIARAQRRLARDPGVAFVAGAGSLAAPLEAIGKLPRGLDSLNRQLKAGKRDLGELDRGLGQASQGAARLRAGLGALRSAGHRLHAGDLTALQGSQELRAGLVAARAGSRELDAGLRRAGHGAKRLEAGSRSASKGAARLTQGLGQARDEVAAGAASAAALPVALRKGSEDLGRLREPVQIARDQLDVALRKLRAMSVGKADPQYVAAYRAVATASGAVNGRNPEDGSHVAAGYDGLDASLAGAQTALAHAGGKADEIVVGLQRLRDALVELGAGSARLGGGIDRMRSGAKELETGLVRLERGSGDLTRGVATLVQGADRLSLGMERLADGSAQLTSGLARGESGSGELGGGIDTIGDRVSGYGTSLPSASGFDRLRSESPGLFKSGYLALAALDGAPRGQRDQAGFAVDIDSGGRAARILVLPKTDAVEPETRELRTRLDAIAHDITRGGQATAYVGGEAAEAMDYRDAALSRLALLVVLLTLTSYLMLVVILRSIVLPIVAVGLNLLTIAAALGVLAVVFRGEAPLFGGPGYIDVLSLTGTFAITCALSIDYEVFLLSRMREGYRKFGTTEAAIKHGLSHTARVITGAAAIMIAVFAAFAVTDFLTIRVLGVGLAVAIVIDATLVRLFLLPAIMRRCGRLNWWLPAWLDRLLPAEATEPSEEADAEADPVANDDERRTTRIPNLPVVVPTPERSTT